MKFPDTPFRKFFEILVHETFNSRFEFSPQNVVIAAIYNDKTLDIVCRTQPQNSFRGKRVKACLWITCCVQSFMCNEKLYHRKIQCNNDSTVHHHPTRINVWEDGI